MLVVDNGLSENRISHQPRVRDFQARPMISNRFGESEAAFKTDTSRALDSAGLTASQGGTCVATAKSGVRRLTPTECARLQGFPDDWLDGLSDSAKYRLLGNAVSIPVAEWIGRRIIEADQS